MRKTMHRKTYTIKPCPFCGNEQDFEITDYKTYKECFDARGSATLRLSCQDCNLDMWEHTCNSEFDYDKKLRMLVDKWNKRI